MSSIGCGWLIWLQVQIIEVLLELNINIPLPVALFDVIVILLFILYEHNLLMFDKMHSRMTYDKIWG